MKPQIVKIVARSGVYYVHKYDQILLVKHSVVESASNSIKFSKPLDLLNGLRLLKAVWIGKF